MIPGPNSVGFIYSLPYQGEEVSITIPVDYSTPSFSILAPQNGITAKSTTLVQGPPQPIQGTTYLYLSGSDLHAGQEIDVSFNISPQAFSPAEQGATPGQSSVSGTILLWVGGIALAVVVGGVLIYMLKRRTVEIQLLEDDPEQMKKRLMSDIAGLDDDFENGEIEEETYTRNRAEKKAQLIELMQGSKEGSGNG
jgi:hypothetical protein